jgi:hypothetical protein
VLLNLKKIEWNKGASEETLCISAQVWVDGKAAFWAVNHGHGGETIIRPVAGYEGPDLAAVNAWLAAEHPAVELEGFSFPYDLEQFVNDEVLIDEQYKTIKRKCRTAVMMCEDGALFSYNFPPVAKAIEAVRLKHPKAVVLNGLHNEFLMQAARQLFKGSNGSASHVG